MAKAKKSESKTETKSAAKPKAPVRKKPEAKKHGGSGSSPMINTDFAAQSAARMLMAKKQGNISTDAGKKESSAFKQMKDNLAKPHLAGMDSMLNSTTIPGANRSNAPFNQTNQRANVNTHGSDMKTGVPRRTPG